MHSGYLIEALIEQTKQVISTAEQLKAKSIDKLTWKPNPNAWNILECLEHLNLYGNYYLPEIEKSVKNSKTHNEPEFRAGILGNYFAKSMLPKDRLNKMKTFKDKNPLNADLDKSVIDKFISQQLKLIELLNESKKVSMNKVKINTSISNLLKLKLGDTFQFFINHNLRHLQQIERIEASSK